MLRWALLFLCFALVAAVLGFGGIAGVAVGIAKLLFWAFIAVAVVTFLLGVLAGRKLEP